MKIINKCWYKNIIPALAGQFLFFVMLSISSILGGLDFNILGTHGFSIIPLSILTVILVFGGVIASILLLRNKYLVIISQLLIGIIGFNILGIHGFSVIMVAILTVILVFGGTIASILILPKKYLVIISQLWTPPIIYIVVYAIIRRWESSPGWYSNNEIDPYTEILPFLIITNVLSIIIAVCIRLIYELILRRRMRRAEQKGGGNDN